MLDADGQVELDDQVPFESTEHFPGDVGTLEYDARRALVQLLRKTHISSASDPVLWQAVIEHEADIRSTMNNFFVQLNIDRRREIAMKWQVLDEDGVLPSVIRPLAYTREQVAVMLIAREALQRATTGDTDDGQMRIDAWLEVEDIINTVMEFPSLVDNRRDSAHKRAREAVDSVRRLTILEGGPHDTRLRVNPIIEILLHADKLAELAAYLRSGDTPATDTDTTETSEVEDDN